MIWSLKRTNFERNIAVVIGINNYKNGIHPLKTPENDANEIANLLETEYEYREVIRLFPPHGEATLKNLNNLLFETLPDKIKPTEGDRLLFYFAGHGVARNAEDGPAGYLIPQDAQLSNLDSFLPMRELHNALGALNCHHLLVILDCCFAGTFRWASTRKLIPVPETIHREHYDRFIRYSAWQVLTSAAHNQEALDFLTDQRGTADNSQHSPFALALIQGLREKKADLTRDNVVTAPELYIYLRDCLITKDGKSEFQTPGLWPLQRHDRGEYIFTKAGFEPGELKPAPTLDENNNPYRGLKPFEEEHSRFFFGRKELVEELYARISQSDQSNNQLIVVLGISGSGKSSLVKAGLIPYIRKEYQQQWHILPPMRPGESPFFALARTILAISDVTVTNQLDTLNFINDIISEKNNKIAAKITEYSAKNGKESDKTKQLKQEREKITTIDYIWKQDNKEAKLLLVVDHFEILNSLCRNDEEREHLKQAVLDCFNPLSQRLQRNPNQFIEILTTWSQKNPDVKLLLVIDQFEELITLSRKTEQVKQDNQPQEWQQFLQLLEVTLAAKLAQLRIIVTLRSDFEPRFLNSNVLKSYWTLARFPVRPMRSDELRQAIEGPANEMALYFEPPNLVDKLIDEVGQMPGALPLLSFTLSELYIKLHKKWREDPSMTDRALTIDAEFDKEGGVAGSLTRSATQEYHKLVKLDPDNERTTRRVMLRMLTIEGGDPARRRVPLSELKYPDDAETQRVQQVIDHLDKARLIVGGQETGEPYVEAAHDYLVRGWGKLQEWIQENLENLALQQRLTPTANDWDRNNRDTGLLLPDGDRLNQLEKILASPHNWLNQRETEFIKNSIEQAKKLRARPELQQKAARVLDLLPVQPLEGLLLAIQSMGQNLETLPEEIFSPVQNSLHQAMEIAREQNIFQRHKGSVYSVAISPDGQYIVSGSEDNTVCLWDTQGNQIDQPFLGHEYGVTSVAMSSDGHYIVSGGFDGTVRLWDKQGNPQGKPFKGHDEGQGVTSVAISPDGQYIVSGSYDKTVRLSDKQGNPQGKPLEHDDTVTSVAISPDGHYIVSGSWDGTVRLWNFKGEPQGKPLEHDDTVSSVAISPDGQYIVSGSWDGTVRLWNFKGELQGKPFQKHEGSVYSVAISRDGQYIVSGGEDKTVRLWDKQGNQICEPLRGHRNYVRSVAISPDGQYIVSGGEDKSMRLWDKQGNQIGQPFRGHKREVTSVAISRDGQYIVSIGNDNTIRLWDKQGKQVGQPFKEQEHKEYYFRAVAISPDGQYIVSASEDTTVRLWGTHGNPQGKPFKGHLNYVTSVAISADGQYIVSGSEDTTVRLWDTQGNPQAKPFRGHEGSVYSVAISPDGQYIVSGGEDKTVRLWDKQGNPQGKPFLGHEDHVTSVVISSDGQYIISGSKDTTVRLWDRQGNQIGQPFRGHNNWVNSVAISPDGEYIISGGEDNTVRLWDTQGNQIGQPFRGHQGSVYSIAISSDGQYIVSSGFDGTVRLWRGGNWQTWLQICCDRLRYHPVFTKPEEIENPEQPSVAIAACETCQKYVWSKANSSV
ncbi:WD-40 repeat-containing protein [Kalymmatonema gypsitolerans NIES-4073]|nr:WD-40 repeat-containing protein [Scytonema sp. NIES-4073]